MYVFPDELRKAYESQPIAMVYDQLIEGKVVPLLITDGFCELVGLDRDHAMEWFREGQYERLHPDDVGRVKRVSVEFASHRSGYDLIFRARHVDGYHVIHTLAEGMETEEHRQFLQEIGCELAQGYLFHKPEPLETTFFRIDAGQKPRAVETPEERELLIREWFEK